MTPEVVGIAKSGMRSQDEPVWLVTIAMPKSEAITLAIGEKVEVLVQE